MSVNGTDVKRRKTVLKRKQLAAILSRYYLLVSRIVTQLPDYLISLCSL